MRYAASPTHRHWHYLGFERYLLFGGDGSAVRRSRKAGFCLGDSFRAATPPAGAGPGPSFRASTESCGAGHPRALAVEEGISVGWGDAYLPYKEGQYISLTGLAAGNYRLVNQADPDRSISETRYDNDVAGVTIEVTWPNGPSSRPAIALVGACSGTQACASRLARPDRRRPANSRGG
jgi:hypothetical protein